MASVFRSNGARLLACLLTAVGSLMWTPAAAASAWRYRLLHGSAMLDTCPPCGRPEIPLPLQGTFDLIPSVTPGVWSEHAVTNIDWRFSLPDGKDAEVTGAGAMRVDSVTGRQFLRLRLRMSGSASDYVFVTDAETPVVTGLWPMFRASLVETQAATLVQVYRLTLVTAPVRELWFSTLAGMTPGVPGPGAAWVSPDDLVSLAGGVVRAGTNVLAGAEFAPALELPATAALQVAPGGDLVYSLRHEGQSRVLGVVGPGDLVSDRGLRLKSASELLAAFRPMPPVQDPGVTAFQFAPGTSGGEVYFCIGAPVFSEGLGETIGPGDVLSDQGRVVRRAKTLLAAFKPSSPDTPTVDALHVWPSGEIWFSLATSLEGAEGPVMSGDLASDQGYVVLRNQELTRPFSPLEDLADFGLDAVQVVSDVEETTAPPRLLEASWSMSPTGVRLRWAGAGVAFVVEKAADLSGPWAPLGPPRPGSEWLDGSADPGTGRGYYRLRQW